MFAALRNNDRVGAFLFTDSIEKFIPARKGRKHILKLLSILVSYEPKSTKTSLKTALAHISKVVKKRSIIFVISDFFAQDFMQPLKILKRRHDIIAMRITDSREKKIPDIGLIELEDEETGEQLLVDTSDREFRQNFLKLMEKKEYYLKANLRKIKIDMVSILTDESYEIPLKKFFKTRQKRVL